MERGGGEKAPSVFVTEASTASATPLAAAA
jgi:hypothetical protein